jgi:Protein of unknown function (DUF3352)
VRRLPIALLAAALLAGCGGSKPAGPEGGAEVAPRSTAVLVRLHTRDAPQWQRVESLLGLFPAGGQLLPSIGKAGDALGPETDAIALSPGDATRGVFLGLTQPKDEAKLNTLLAKAGRGLVSEQVRGWRVIARGRPAIDRFKVARNGGSLAESDRYREATADLPSRALATVYADGAAVTAAADKRLKTGTGPFPGLGRVEWLAGALEPARGGLSLDLRVKADEIEATQYAAELPAEAPAGAALFVDLEGLDATLDELRRSPAFSKQLGVALKALGGVADSVIALFKGEAAFYVRPGPECTLVVKVADEESARSTLDKLATIVSALQQEVPEPVEIAGIRATKLTFEKQALFYAVFDGKAVVTTARSGIRGLATMGPRLADSQAWRSAKAAAAMPDQTAGIVFADGRRLAPLAARLTKNPRLLRNLAPLGTAIVYGTVAGSVLSLKGFVSVR